ncbi:MAG: DNA-directed RNA polymerase subunit omega [Pseudomonadota bacterium]|nr:DNA-directed RNA polymerase subunit omega [Pseudomonadota bacterium]
MTAVSIVSCVSKVSGNRFALVLLASQRAHQLAQGSPSPVANLIQGHKPTVASLIEIENDAEDPEEDALDSFDEDLILEGL